jgi:hypothetical protein
VQGLQDGLDEEQLTEEMAAQFEVESNVAAHDLAEFLTRLRMMQLL